MKKTEIQKIRDMSVEEQETRIAELKKELFNLRFQSAINQLDNPMRLKAVKKEIAVIKTVMSENKTENGAEA